MSVGPSERPDNFETGVVAKTAHIAKRAALGFFSSPLHYVFWTLIGAVSIGLLFSVSFPIELYVLIGILAMVKLSCFVIEKNYGGNL